MNYPHDGPRRVRVYSTRSSEILAINRHLRVLSANGLWLLKKSSFLPNSQNLGDTKCLEN